MAEYDMKKKTKECWEFRDAGLETINFNCFKEAINVEEMDVKKISVSHEFA